MKFSLVTTCWNEMRSLPRWRKDIQAQTREPDEIVIVDNLSTDGTRELLAEWTAQNPRLKVIEQKCGAAQGRNLAIREATCDPIISTDMGVTVDAHWFEEIARPFEEDASVQVVAGNYCIDKSSVKSAAARAEYFLENGGGIQFGPDFVIGNRSVGYLKKVWHELGGLPEDLTLYADDSVFGRQILKAGYKMAFAPKAMVYWSRPARLRDFWKEQFRYGKGDGEAAIKTPFAFGLYQRKRLPRVAVPWVTALRNVQKSLRWSAVRSAVAAGDLPAALLMPALVFGNGYYFANGYLIGHRHGDEHCLACRERLRS